MLGRELVGALVSSGDFEVVPLARGDLDITDGAAARESLALIKPHYLVNCAAYADVDGCERNPGLAYSVNAYGAGFLARACAELKIRLIHISSDYVFDGLKRSPYLESDVVAPLNVYGKSKLKGEELVLEASKRHLVVRSSWLYALWGKNFVNTILNLAARQKEIKVVGDQVGSPTFTRDLSLAIRALILAKEAAGIVHAANGGVCSWYEFARAILDKAPIEGVSVVRVSADELKRPAKRPGYSVLDTTLYSRIAGHPMKNWAEALDDFFKIKSKGTHTPS